MAVDPRLLEAMRANGEIPPGPQDLSPDVDYSARFSGPGEAALANIGGGMMGMAQGAKALGMQMSIAVPQILSNPFGKKLVADRVEAYSEQVERDMKALDLASEDFPLASFAGRLAGEIAAVPVPPAGKLMGVAMASFKKKLAVAIAEGGAITGLVHPREGESRAGNIAQGMIGAGVIRSAGGLAGKVMSAKAGRMGDETAQFMQDTGKKMGVDVISGDAAGKMMERVNFLMEMVPFIGTSGKRAKQISQITEGLQKVGQKYKALFQDYGDSAIEAIKKGHATELFRRQTKGGKLFDLVTKMMGDNPVPTPRLNKMAQNLLDKEMALGAKGNEGIATFLKKYTMDSGLDFESFRTVRSRLKQELRDLPVGSTEAARMSKLIGAIEEDAKAALKGDARRADRIAREYWRKKVSPLKDDFFTKGVADPDKLDTMTRKYLQTRNADNAKRLYRGLDETGRKAMRYSVIDEALEQATDSNGLISGPKFHQVLKNYRKVSGAIFKPEELKEITGIRRFLNGMKSAYRQGTEPTGMGALKVGVLAGSGAGAMADIGTAGQMSAGFLALRSLLGTDRGRRFIRSAADYGPGKIGDALENMTLLAQRMGALGSADL